jgi:hypothetical protein
MKKILIFLLFLFSLNFVFALQVGNTGEEGVNFNKRTTSSINYSTVNVNNSDYLDGHDSDYFCVNTSLINYVPYTGATQNVNLGSKSITTTGVITTNNLMVSVLDSPTSKLELGIEIIPAIDDFLNFGNTTNRFNHIFSNFFVGNGSLLTSVCLTNGTNCQASSGGVNGTAINVTSIQHSGNITNPVNDSWGYFNNGSCIVIGKLEYVNQC